MSRFYKKATDFRLQLAEHIVRTIKRDLTSLRNGFTHRGAFMDQNDAEMMGARIQKRTKIIATLVAEQTQVWVGRL